MSDQGILYIVATPIGNLEDLADRAKRVLGEVNVLACEDTRRTRILYEKFGISSPGKIISYREQNEKTAGPGIVKLLMEGQNVALCSDAGYPALSDPGYRLIRDAIEEGIKIVVIPGAGAIETAVVVSGLPTDSFIFMGFPPKKPGQLRNMLAGVKELPNTLVFFESPLRVGKLLVAGYEVLGDRRVAVCIELTKVFEEIDRGWLSEMSGEYESKKIKGEVTVVIAGNNRKFIRSDPE